MTTTAGLLVTGIRVRLSRAERIRHPKSRSASPLPRAGRGEALRDLGCLILSARDRRTRIPVTSSPAVVVIEIAASDAASPYASSLVAACSEGLRSGGQCALGSAKDEPAPAVA